MLRRRLNFFSQGIHGGEFVRDKKMKKQSRERQSENLRQGQKGIRTKQRRMSSVQLER